MSPLEPGALPRPSPPQRPLLVAAVALAAVALAIVTAASPLAGLAAAGIVALGGAIWNVRVGAVLLAAGTKGKRYTLPHSRILIHQPSMSGLAGQAADIDIYAKEILRMRETLNGILADACGQPIERIARDVDRDYIMSAAQALEYGIIDRVISSRELTPVK